MAKVTALYLALLLAQPPAVAQPESTNDAIAVWERAIAAKGGRNRLRAVENLLLSARSKTEQLFVFPNRFWLWHDDLAEMFNPDEKICWQVRTRTAPVSACQQSLEYIAEPVQLAYLLESRWVRPQPLRTWRAVLAQGGGNAPLWWRSLHPELHRRQVDMLRAVWKGWTVDYYLDASSHIPLRVRVALTPDAPLRPGDHDYRFSDYAEVNGIWMPTHQSTYGAWEDIQCRTQVLYDEEIFRRQPRLEAGPEAWKPAASPARAKRN